MIVKLFFVGPSELDKAYLLARMADEGKPKSRSDCIRQAEMAFEAGDELTETETDMFGHLIPALASVSAVPALEDLLSQRFLDDKEIQLTLDIIRRSSKNAVIKKAKSYAEDLDEDSTASALAKLQCTLATAASRPGTGLLILTS